VAAAFGARTADENRDAHQSWVEGRHIWGTPDESGLRREDWAMPGRATVCVSGGSGVARTPCRVLAAAGDIADRGPVLRGDPDTRLEFGIDQFSANFAFVRGPLCAIPVTLQQELHLIAEFTGTWFR
jgi:hypothetical protein